MLKKSMALTAAMAAILSSGSALADASVNAAATTNYVWRGVTQSTDTASVSGGIDWSNASGLYVGVWSGSLVGGTETDVYAGFTSDVGSLGYDVGVLTYQYSQTPDINFTELYLNVSLSDLTVGIASTVSAADGNKTGMFDKGDMYVSASYGFKAGVFDASAYGGSYMFENDNLFGNGDLDYNHYGLSFTSGEVTVALEKNDIDGANNSNVRVVATWSKAWDL
ncbi:MAG: TorF family putative porin [Gammaproteobacteria bacterium]|nr:TorF family putative porin [Gammaproteobacteria bacterium]